jgi:hypothetical protein
MMPLDQRPPKGLWGWTRSEVASVRTHLRGSRTNDIGGVSGFGGPNCITSGTGDMEELRAWIRAAEGARATCLNPSELDVLILQQRKRLEAFERLAFGSMNRTKGSTLEHCRHIPATGANNAGREKKPR